MTPEIDQSTFAARLVGPDAYVVDVRETDEFGHEHVPGTRNLPLGELATRMSELPTDRPVRTGV